MKEPQAPLRLEAPPQRPRTKLYSLPASWRRQFTRNCLTLLWILGLLLWFENIKVWSSFQFPSETWKLPLWPLQRSLSLGCSLQNMVSSTFAHIARSQAPHHLQQPWSCLPLGDASRSQTHMACFKYHPTTWSNELLLSPLAKLIILCKVAKTC